MSRRNKGNQRPVSAEPTANAAEGTEATNTTTEATAEGEGEGETEDEQLTEAPQPDPFAEMPVVSVGDGVEFVDYSDSATANPRKYEAVNAAAIADRSPTAKGWKHERAILVPGKLKKEFKQGSVYGTIQQIVAKAGRDGIPAYVVANRLRREQIGNKRSHYCEGLPPVGWAEGWINTAITKSIVGVHASKQAPLIRPEAEPEPEAEQGKIAANG